MFPDELWALFPAAGGDAVPCGELAVLLAVVLLNAGVAVVGAVWEAQKP